MCGSSVTSKVGDVPTRYVGTVVKHGVAGRSKSARQAVLLRTETGEEFILRRLGGHPFHDELIEKLVGKRIEGSGRTTGTTLLLSKWKEL